jgi:riboflavin kinase/FMN adenylyltransferase
MIILNNISDIHKHITNEDVNVTIGNFDGVHLGHKNFINYIKSECLNKNRKLLVITFVPHPSFVLKAKPNFLINTYQERRELLKELGVDYLLEINFTRDFSTLTPQEFLNKYIFCIQNIKKLFLGFDFQFGANKTGNFDLAKAESEKNGVDLVLHSEFKTPLSTVSSTVIRSKIESGNVDEINALLGREYFLTGRVIKGMGRGKQIGFPTANLGYDKDLIIPARGVYITKSILSGMAYESVTNVGVNPTFNTGYEIHVETHILGFSRDIYGEELKVCFLSTLRNEKKFSSVNELVSQIEEDVLKAKTYFKNA